MSFTERDRIELTLASSGRQGCREPGVAAWGQETIHKLLVLAALLLFFKHRGWL
jgi:hypothetical protein